MLEDEELIQSHSGAKSYMILDDAKIERIKEELLENDAQAIVRAMKQMGLSKTEAISLIEKFWERGV